MLAPDELVARYLEEAARRRWPDTLESHRVRWAIGLGVILAGSVALWWTIIALVIRVMP